jgi:hypothetical protein
MYPALSRRGIALPLTIFVITLITVMLAAAFARVAAERALAAGSSDAVSALTVAQSGLQAYLGSRTSRPPDGDSVRYNVTGGYADVVARLVESDSLDDRKTTYIVRSTGYIIVPALGANTQGKRTVAQFAQWQSGVIRQYAAWVAANDLHDQSPYRITVNGNDACGDSAATWAVRTQNSSSYTHSAGQGSYSGAFPSPNESGSGNQVANETGVDWSTIVSGGFVPEHTSLLTGDTLYGSYLIQGDATVSNASGTGLLIVTDDLTMSGAFASWSGLVLVGDEIRFLATDSTVFRGMVISGLNGLLGSTHTIDFGATRVNIRYDSCRISKALARLTGFFPVPNAWVDNWASY